MHRGPVLLDNNCLLEIERVGAWKALAGAYRLVTVETCFAEFCTGPKSAVAGRPQGIAAYRALFTEVAAVTPTERAAFALRGGPAIDEGERDLWAHALARADGWALCGPDRASLRWGFENGFRDRLVSLGGLLGDIGVRKALRRHFEHAWQDEVLRRLALGIL